jgi:hypothetical protein
MAKQAKPSLTSAQRRAAKYGTKRWATVELRDHVRAYAKARRAYELARERWSTEHEKNLQHGMALGAWSALVGTGLLSHEQQCRWMSRIKRITHAKVTRRPFGELRRVA